MNTISEHAAEMAEHLVEFGFDRAEWRPDPSSLRAARVTAHMGAAAIAVTLTEDETNDALYHFDIAYRAGCGPFQRVTQGTANCFTIDFIPSRVAREYGLLTAEVESC